MNTLPTTEPFYVVETPEPSTWIDPDLTLFYHRAQKYLADGVQPAELSSWLDMEERLVRFNLDYLRQLGFVRLTDEHETAAIQERRQEEKAYEEGIKSITRAKALPGTGVLLVGYAYYFWFC